MKLKAMVHVDQAKGEIIVSVYGAEGRLLKKVNCKPTITVLDVAGKATITIPKTLSPIHFVAVIDADKLSASCADGRLVVRAGEHAITF